MIIRTANQQPVVKAKGGYRAWLTEMVLQRWDCVINWDDVQGVVAAEIVRSNWRVSCPFCRGAVVYEPGEPFICPDCVNQANEHHPMMVAMPPESYRQQIETVLLKRPDPNTRNWLPHETVTMLKAENLEHGHEA